MSERTTSIITRISLILTSLLLITYFVCLIAYVLIHPQKITERQSGSAAAPKDFGVNMASAEFNDWSLPGNLNIDYTYPKNSDTYSFFASKNLTLIRLPILWERIQKSALGQLSTADLSEISTVLNLAQANGQKVILELHNYGRYYKTPLQNNTTDKKKLNDVWIKIAEKFKNHPALYGYEIMNEPHDMPGESTAWVQIAQSATSAIRQVDNQHFILIPGYSWQTARFWRDNNEQLNIFDPADKLLYAAHQYFDSDYSGTYTHSYDQDAIYPTIGAERAQPFIDWLKQYNKKGIFTEYGIPSNDSRWNTVLDLFLQKIAAEDLIVGGTAWAAGPWWGDYNLEIEPFDGPSGTFGGQDPQITILQKFPSTTKFANQNPQPSFIQTQSNSTLPPIRPTIAPTATPQITLRPTPIPSTVFTQLSPLSTGTRITIYAQGTQARGIYPTMQLLIADRGVISWSNVSYYKPYTYTHPTKISASTKVYVKFLNDEYVGPQQDRNLRVDKIIIDGVTTQTESSKVFSTASAVNGKCAIGYLSNEWLNCNGLFRYR